MAVDPSIAARAYAAASGLGGPQSKQGALSNPGEFSELVNSAIQNVSQTGKSAETVTAQLGTGQADVVDLVTAVAETEVAVQTLVTVRDRVISAYQDILNMPI